MSFESTAVVTATETASVPPAVEEAPQAPAVVQIIRPEPTAAHYAADQTVRPVLLIPPNVGALAKLAAKEHHRYAMDGVLVECTEPGYRVVATDGRVLGVVEGPSDDANNFPDIPGLNPATCAAAIIPAKDFAGACKAIKPGRYSKPILNNLALSMRENETNLGSTDLERANVGLARHVDGRFPYWREVLPKSHVTSVEIDAEHLLRVLTAARTFADEGKRVTIEVGGSNILVVRSKSSNGQVFTGAVSLLGK